MVLDALKMYEEFIEFLENNMVECYIHKYFGFDCLGCGMQRSFIELLKGNILQSFELYPALIPLIALFCVFIVHIIFKLKHGAKIIRILMLANVAIILIGYFVKLFFK